MNSSTPLLPPGTMGLPILGETLSFGLNPFGFLEARWKRYGDVFKSNLFGRKIVFLTGTAGAEAFYNAENITRSDAHPFPLVQMFGGINMEMYDGPRHLALKSMALQAFDHTAIAGYLPDMQRLIEMTLDRLSQVSDFSATVELRRLSIEVICANVLGLPPGPETNAMTKDYGMVLPGLVAIPLRIPGGAYRRAMAARDRVLARIRTVIGERRRNPGTDALSRMLGARAGDGRVFTDDEAMLEVHHIVIAGFIVYALMAEVLRRLAEQPDLYRRCADEVHRFVPRGELTMDGLSMLNTPMNVVLETKRYVPLVPLAFGRAKRTFTHGGFKIPENWSVYLVLSLNNYDRAVFTKPETFDPNRFERGEHQKHPMAFIPQGAEPPTGHRCLGLDYSTFLTLTFLTILVRSFEWELPRQNLAYNWQKLPPEPHDGLRVALQKKS